MLVGFDDSLQKFLAQTMLNQEDIFRNQVLELHRLYEIQKMLMRELDLNVSVGESPHSYTDPFSNHFNYESLAMEMKLNGVHTMFPSRCMNMHCLKEHISATEQHHRHLDLELPANHYVRDGEDIFCESNGHITPRLYAKKTFDTIYDDKVSSMEELKLTLQADIDTWRKSSGQKAICLEGSTSHEGVEQCQEDVSLKSTSARRKLFTCHELDLNKALPDDDSSLHSIDCSISKNNWSSEPAALDQEDMTNSTLTTSPSKDLGSICGPLSDSRIPISCSKDSFMDKNCHKISVPEKNFRKNKELVEGTGSNSSSSNREFTSNSCDQKKQELTQQADVTVRKGAVSLLYFSSECLSRNQENVSSSKKRKEVPQSSSESFESIVLKQRECRADEYYCASSIPVEVSSSMEKKDYGARLKRGRRMKDFQKEILPSLASLSRQEISEDIKIMELAIRSREYKKYRSKMGGTSDCFSSVRSRRSRLRYVARRYYS